MVSWNELLDAEPELGGRVQGAFERQVHHTMATLRRNGSPRISATEVDIRDGEMWLGSMWQARKALDLLHDPRVAIHCGTTDPDPDDPHAMPADAKVAGRAVEVTDQAILDEFAEKAPPGPFHLFRVDIDEVVVTFVGDPPDHMVVDFWTTAHGRRTVRRT